ncbi:MAG: lysylphosphatidylglycerol synthase transmembrane domain-containing protein [Leptospirales bacterium]
MISRKKILHLSVALSISGIALYFALRNISLHRFANMLWKGHYVWLIPTILLLLSTMGMRALFWRQTLSVTRSVGIAHLFSSVVVGYMASNILPFRAGEMVRALYTKKIEKIPLPILLSTIFIERLFDMVSLSLIIFLFLTMEGQSVGHKSLWIIGGTGGVFMLLFSLVHFRMGVLKLLEGRILPFFSGHRIALRLLHLITLILHSLSGLTSPIKLFGLFLTSLAIWTLTLLSTWLCLVTFDITLHPVEVTMAFLVYTELALLIPSSPGGIGVRQLAAIYALRPFHVSDDKAIAASLISQLLSILITSVLGYLFISRSHLTLSGIRDQSEKNPDP